ncbi:MAG TPA: zinc-binding alcohol dehydrogenase [Armatimonadota bacterium]|jgi:2-desacetyl-2-hydroxyethyl bacteriochlorophyllide A dehydrogenase
MQAHALICDAQQRFTLEEVILPDPGPQDIVVRTRYSGVSIGTEFALIRNKISWGPYPLCTGYQAVGVVEAVGNEVSGFAPGTQVYLRRNQPFHLANGQVVSPVSGTHSSYHVIPSPAEYGLEVLPDGIDLEAASMFVMPAVGLFGVDMANPRMGQLVAVYGAGLIGLGVIAACSQRGCRVMAFDIDDARLEIARSMGADLVVNTRKDDALTALHAVAPEGADAVFECTGIPACVNETLPLCKTFGTFVMQGNYGDAPLGLNFIAAHGRRLTMYFPCDDGQAPCRRAVLNNMARNVLPWGRTITHRVAYTKAADLYHRINTGNAAEVLGAVIQWS